MSRKSLFQEIWIWLDLAIVIFTGIFLYYYSYRYPQSNLAGVLIVLYSIEVFAVLVSTLKAAKTSWSTDDHSGNSGVL
jgi:hypothetical protein